MKHSEIKSQIIDYQMIFDKKTKLSSKRNYALEQEVIPQVIKNLDNYRKSLIGSSNEVIISNIILRISYFYQKTINGYCESHLTPDEEVLLDKAYQEINWRCNPYLYKLTDEEMQNFRNAQVAYIHDDLQQLKYYYDKCCAFSVKPIAPKVISKTYYDIIRELTYYDNAKIYYQRLQKISEELNDYLPSISANMFNSYQRSLNHIIDYHNFF